MTTNPQGSAGAGNRPYELVISRLTVDKLGVKLYDKASAVVAELIANAYDADAELVTVRLPLGSQLAKKAKTGPPKDLGFIIEVEDHGHGMTPDEAIDFYLRVGQDRRKNKGQGSVSRKKKRPVMGRKGIGKLAPFGICRTIEVISAGGPKTSQGYLKSHFFLNFDDIVKDTDETVPLKAGPKDRTYQSDSGTLIRLTNFLPKRVPPSDVFHRQLARRFIFAEPEFKIFVKDTKDPKKNPPRHVQPFDVPLLEGTKIDVSKRPVPTDDGEKLPVKGWLGLAKEAYKDEEMAGVRIYARNKIVATTRDFEQPAGFTGEFTTRSYLVGEIYAEWLDADDDEDLIRTDRQGILWDSEYGTALRKWGADLIREIGAASRKPRRERVKNIFLTTSAFEKRAKKRYSDASVVRAAMNLAEQIGGFASEDELQDTNYVEELSSVILSVAPHRALIEAFQEFSKITAGKEVQLEQLTDLFGKTRIAEIASYGQIAAERVRIISELEKIIHKKKSSENDLQELISRAPWLVHPTWTVITVNQKLKTFKTAFEAFWKKKKGKTVVLAITYETKRPDFTLVSVDDTLHIVEIKAAGHTFNDADFQRMHNYVEAFLEFFANNEELRKEFHRGWQIDLIADKVKLSNTINRAALKSYLEKKIVVPATWNDFLVRTKVAHETFLDIHDAAIKKG